MTDHHSVDEVGVRLVLLALPHAGVLAAVARVAVGVPCAGFALVLSGILFVYHLQNRHAEQVLNVEKRERREAENLWYWSSIQAAFAGDETGRYHESFHILQNSPPHLRDLLGIGIDGDGLGAVTGELDGVEPLRHAELDGTSAVADVAAEAQLRVGRDVRSVRDVGDHGPSLPVEAGRFGNPQ